MATTTQQRPGQRQLQPRGGPAQQELATANPQAPPTDVVAPEQIASLETAIAECATKFQESTGTLARAFAISYGLRRLEALITPAMMTEIMSLMNSPLGFLTDKNPSQYTKDGSLVRPYDVAIVKRCVIEAALRDARWVGNEFNIIAARAYLTKEYFRRKVAELPGLSRLQLNPGVPVMSQSGAVALVPFTATWRFGGNDFAIERTAKKVGDDVHDRRIPVIVNAKMSADAVLGKAERKMLAAIYRQMTGSAQVDALEVEPDEGPQIVEGAVLSSAEVGQDAPAESDAETAAEAETAQAAAEGSQDREPGCDDDTGAENPPEKLSFGCLEIEDQLHDPGLGKDATIKIKLEIASLYTAGKLTAFEAGHLQRIVAEKLEQFGK